MASDAFSPESANRETQTDAELSRALLRGETTALARLYDRYADVVYGLALRRLRNPEEAEDLTQDVFLSLYQKNQYDPARGSLLSFLTTVTHSRALDRLRSRGSKFRFLNRWNRSAAFEHPTLNPIQAAVSDEEAAAVRQALTQLSDNERQILEIAYYEGVTQAEIAQRLNLPLGTVKTRSRQGLKKLRRALKDLIE